MRKILLHPLFVVYIILLLAMGQLLSVLVYLIVVGIHEYAHYIVAKRLGYKLGKFLIMPYGVCLNYKTSCFVNNDEILIAIAGPTANFLMFVITIAIWWIFPSTYAFSQVFCLSNLVMFCFNLLPCFPLDGGRVFAGILSKKMKRKNAIKVCLVFNIVVSCVFVLCFVIGVFMGIVNLNLIIVSLFLLAGAIEPKAEFSYNYLTYGDDKINHYKKGVGVNFICVDYSMELYKICSKLSKNKFNVIYAVYENSSVKCFNEIVLKKLMISYSPTTKLNEIFEMFI